MAKPTRLAPILGAIVLAIGIAAPAAAQDDAVPFQDVAGTTLGTILIREVADPYTEFEPTRPPVEGTRYALLTVTFEAAEDQPFPTDPRQIQLQDANGYLYGPAGVPRPADSVSPDLQSQTLSPFDRVSGVVGYVLPEDASIVRIVYRGDGSRLVPITEPGDGGAVAVGEPRTFALADGTALGTITVRDVADPYADFVPTQPPAEGQRFVMLTLAFDAAADQALFADPRAVFLVDTNGSVYRPTRIAREPGELLQELDIQPLSPEDRVSGVIGYTVPADAVLAGIIYNSEGNRFVPIADL
jgi:hypothetical protein